MVPDKIILKSVSVPSKGFGTYKLTGNEAIKAIEYALGIGYKHIDTAQFYNNEEEVGKAVRNSGIDRDNVFITTKIFPSEFKNLIKANINPINFNIFSLMLLAYICSTYISFFLVTLFLFCSLIL